MNRSLNIAGAALFVVALTVTGCQKSEEYKDEQTAEPAAMPAPAPAEKAAPAPATPAAMQLEAKNNSGISGEVTRSQTGSDVTVLISLNGLKDGVTYPAHIHTGTCATEGAVAVELTSVSASGTTGQSSTTVEAAKVPAQAFVQIHDASGKPVACTDLTVSVPAQ